MSNALPLITLAGDVHRARNGAAPVRLPRKIGQVDKEEGIARRFKSSLVMLHEGLDHVWRIGERCRGIAQHDKVDITGDRQGDSDQLSVAGTILTGPGVYGLRTNVIDRDQETL